MLSHLLVVWSCFISNQADELQMGADGSSEWPIVVFIIEMTDNFVIVFFSLEFVVRLIICPNKIKFMRDPMNIIDICAIVPFYLSLLLEGLEDFEIIGKTGKMIRLVRVMRILRIFKLVRHFAGLQSLLYTLQQAYKELGLLFLIIGKGSHQKKKITKFWTLSKHGGVGVSGAAKLFFEKRYGHVLRGEGGQRAMSKVVFCKKVCFGVPEELLCVKIIYILHASKHELQYHIPTQAL